ncbi:MAG: ADP-ribosylglycohydrolase family protein [Caldicoprobacterales bacterium]
MQITKKIVLNEKDYWDKAYGGWLGKNIGGTLGEPVEGRMEVLELTFYPRLSEGPLPNDDLDLQLVWLHAVEQYGARLTAKELGQEWLEHVFFPYDEYGYALTNLRRGINPPVAGWFGNPFTNCMGSPIRSEIWAMLAPGAPATAARYAWQDAIVDHAGGEGVYGEMFFAAIESAAFIHSDVDLLLDIGLSMIPENCRVAKAVSDLRKWHREGKDWLEARELILKHHGHPNFTDAPQNIAFTILGWLYGEDFGDAILKAVNCGYDTDCTGATLGAILGIIGGKDSLPEKWVKPVGNRIAVSPPIKGFPAPKDLDELTFRTLVACKEVLAAWNLPITISSTEKTYVDPAALNCKGLLKGEETPENLWNYIPWEECRPLPAGSGRQPGLEVFINYGPEGPAIGRGETKEITFTIVNHTGEAWEGKLNLEAPKGWKGSGEISFNLREGKKLEYKVEVTSDNNVLPSYKLALNIERYHDGSYWTNYPVHFALVAACHFTVWGPDDNEGYSITSPGNRIAFEKAFDKMLPGVYKARTTIKNPAKRMVEIIAATSSPVRVSLNGKILFEDLEETIFMPAYHRAPASKRAELLLPEGEHVLEIEVKKGEDPLDIYLLPVATRDTRSPGSHYYYTDILFI